MRKISLWLLILVFTASLARAQVEDATQQQLDKLSGQIQDLLDAQAAQGKRLAALEKQIGDLGERLSQPAPVNDSASAADLKKLAAQVQEIDQKRQADNNLILKEIESLGKEIEKLGKAGGSAAHPKPVVASDPPPTPGGKQKGYEQEVHSGDNVSAIAKAYQDKGVKVTVKQILDANPGLDPKNLKVGQKIFIPDPAAK
jgi:LysM repeat protein